MSIVFKESELNEFPVLEKIECGLKVVSLKGNHYEKLEGEIVDIKYGKDRETQNESILEIYVDFYEPEDGSFEKNYAHLNGTSIEQVIMGEDMLAFYFDNENIPTNIDGMLVCPTCLEPMESVTEVQYEDITWRYNKDTKTYVKEVGIGDSSGKKCSVCSSVIEDNSLQLSY